MRSRFTLYPIAAALVVLLGGCAVGPTYQRPLTPEVSSYKEAEGWVPAAPADALERGPWWSLFGDPVLDQLAARVEVSNQNVAAAVAAYAQARALVREQRASLFPAVTLGSGATRSGSGGTKGQGAQAVAGGQGTGAATGAGSAAQQRPH